MPPAFPCEIAEWQALAVYTEAWPTHLANIVHFKLTHIEFCDALGLGVGGM